MPATIQGYRPDPRIRQRELAELRQIYGEVIHAQQGAIVFLAGEPGSGRRATACGSSSEVTDVHPR